MGVGVGEAGGVAPAYSLIADYFPPHQRARALAAFAFGIPLGHGGRHPGRRPAGRDLRLAHRLHRRRPAGRAVAPLLRRRSAIRTRRDRRSRPRPTVASGRAAAGPEGAADRVADHARPGAAAWRWRRCHFAGHGLGDPLWPSAAGWRGDRRLADDRPSTASVVCQRASGCWPSARPRRRCAATASPAGCRCSSCAAST